MVKRFGLDILLAIAAVCLGIGIYKSFGAGPAWLYGGLILLVIWYVMGSARDVSGEE